MTTPSSRDVTVRLSAESRQRAADLGQRMLGQIGAERLLLHRQQLGSVELGGRDRRPVLSLARGAAALSFAGGTKQAARGRYAKRCLGISSAPSVLGRQVSR